MIVQMTPFDQKVWLKFATSEVSQWLLLYHVQHVILHHQSIFSILKDFIKTVFIDDNFKQNL